MVSHCIWIQVTNLRTSAKAQRLLTTLWFLILVFVKMVSNPLSILSTVTPLLFICPLVPSIFMSRFLLKPVASSRCCSLFQGKRPSAQSCVHPQHQHLWVELTPSFPEAISGSWFPPFSVLGFCLARCAHVVTATVDSYVQLAWHVQKTQSYCSHATPLPVISFWHLLLQWLCVRLDEECNANVLFRS